MIYQFYKQKVKQQERTRSSACNWCTNASGVQLHVFNQKKLWAVISHPCNCTPIIWKSESQEVWTTNQNQGVWYRDQINLIKICDIWNIAYPFKVFRGSILSSKTHLDKSRLVSKLIVFTGCSDVISVALTFKLRRWTKVDRHSKSLWSNNVWDTSRLLSLVNCWSSVNALIRLQLPKFREVKVFLHFTKDIIAFSDTDSQFDTSTSRSGWTESIPNPESVKAAPLTCTFVILLVCMSAKYVATKSSSQLPVFSFLHMSASQISSGKKVLISFHNFDDSRYLREDSKQISAREETVPSALWVKTSFVIFQNDWRPVPSQHYTPDCGKKAN